MRAERLCAFTDGVVAIAITIMVRDLPIPHGDDLAALRPVLPLFGAYVLAFVNVGIFWSNHHHMLQAVKHVDGSVLWANNLLLFWMTLIPFVIRWIGEKGITAFPTAAYGVVLIMASMSYVVLERALIRAEGELSQVREAVGTRLKEWISLIGYVSAVPLAFISPYISVGIYGTIAAVWLIPDRRFERRLNLQG